MKLFEALATEDSLLRQDIGSVSEALDDWTGQDDAQPTTVAQEMELPSWAPYAAGVALLALIVVVAKK